MATKFTGTGHRKTSIAKVVMVSGKGKITVNGKDVNEYFELWHGAEVLRAVGHVRAEGEVHQAAVRHRLLPGVRRLQRPELSAADAGGVFRLWRSEK